RSSARRSHRQLPHASEQEIQSVPCCAIPKTFNNCSKLRSDLRDHFKIQRIPGALDGRRNISPDQSGRVGPDQPVADVLQDETTAVRLRHRVDISSRDQLVLQGQRTSCLLQQQGIQLSAYLRKSLAIW